MSLQLPGQLWLIGAGKMGCAMAAGWLEDGLDPALVRVQDPRPGDDAKALFAKYRIDILAAITETVPPSVVVLAVKPQMMDAGAAGIKTSHWPKQSVAIHRRGLHSRQPHKVF